MTNFEYKEACDVNRKTSLIKNVDSITYFIYRLAFTRSDEILFLNFGGKTKVTIARIHFTTNVQTNCNSFYNKLNKPLAFN